MKDKYESKWRDRIDAVLYIILLCVMCACACGCMTKRVAVSTATIDKSAIHIDTSMTISYREDIARDRGIEYKVIEIEETTTEAIKDTSGVVISPAKKSVIKREITAVKKDEEIVSRDTTITQVAIIEELRDIDTKSEEEVIPPNRTAMWVFFSLVLLTLVGGAVYVKKKFF